MAEWLGQINPWIGSLVAISGAVLAYVRLRIRLRNELESQVMREVADRNKFRQSLLEHIAYIEDKRRKLERRIGELETSHRRELRDMQAQLAQAHQRHMDCEERLIAVMKGSGE